MVEKKVAIVKNQPAGTSNTPRNGINEDSNATTKRYGKTNEKIGTKIKFKTGERKFKLDPIIEINGNIVI